MVQSLRRSVMTNYSLEEKAVATTIIFKMKMQQAVKRIEEEHL